MRCSLRGIVTLMTHGGDDDSLIPGWMSPSGGEEEPLFCSVLTGSSRSCAHKCNMLIMCADDRVFCLFVLLLVCLFLDPMCF